MSASRRGTGTLLLMGAAHSLNHSLFLVLPPLLGVISGDLGVSFKEMGFVTTVAFLLYGLGALVGGPLSDRIGEVKIASVSIALAGASTVVFLLPKNIYVFSAGMFLVAAWASFYHPTSNNLIAKAFPENTAGAMGIHGAAASLGQMFTPTVAYILGTRVDWRLSFVFFGALSVLVGVLLTRVRTSEDVRVSERVPLTRIFVVPNIWVIILFNVVIGLYNKGIELFFPAFLTVMRGFPGQAAAMANSAFLLFGMVGQLAAGWAADRYSSVRVVIIASAGMVAGMLLLLLFPIRNVGVVLFIVFFGLSYFGHQPAMTALLGSVSPPGLMGTAYGVMFFFAFGLGSVSTTIVGFIADAFDLEMGFWILTLFSVLTLFIALFIPRVIEKSHAKGV
ncbi:MAG: MFS transporter [Candidatus Bathyarchaeota archaeon]|nr:MFS transporter [Candidatus Bathyarchaeota archaeon]